MARGAELCGDSLDVSNDGNTLLVGSHRSEAPLQLYDLRALVSDLVAAEAPRGLPSHREGRDGSVLASYEWRGNEDLSVGAKKASSRCLLLSAAWDSDNAFVAAAGENENAARVFARPQAPDEPLQVVGTLTGQSHAFYSAAMTEDGRGVAFGCADGAVALLELQRRPDLQAR